MKNFPYQVLRILAFFAVISLLLFFPALKGIINAYLIVPEKFYVGLSESELRQKVDKKGLPLIKPDPDLLELRLGRKLESKETCLYFLTGATYRWFHPFLTAQNTAYIILEGNGEKRVKKVIVRPELDGP